MIFKGLLVIIAGFLFIFSSGVPMRLISHYKPNYPREGLYWGIGIWIIAFFVSNFFQNLIRQIATAGTLQPNQQSPITYLIGAVITTLLLQYGMRLYLKRRSKKGEDLVADGLALGFGVGVIAQVFTGMILIAAGLGVVFQGAGLHLNLGEVQRNTIDVIFSENLGNLIFALLSLILYRIALLTVSASQGYMVARSINSKQSWFWLGLATYTAFNWLIFFLQMLLGEPNPGQISLGMTSLLTSLISAAYYLGVFILGTRWLNGELQSELKKPVKKKRSK